MSKYVIGLDFGTESGRVLVVDVATGEEVGSAVHRYEHGVIDETLPGTGARLEPDTALQAPGDYLKVLKIAVPQAIRHAKINADDVIGIGVDFTACTILPTTASGQPLCEMDEWKANPHAWVKLWKHHAAQPEAQRINELARERGEKWLPIYGGIVSSEWLLSKTLQILNDAPEVYAAADAIVEEGDWVIWKMTGVMKRNACAAGYKGMWVKGMGFPNNDFLNALDPRLNGLNETKLAGEIVPPGALVGKLTAQAAGWMGLRPGTAVGAAIIDAHAAVPGAGVTEPGRMVMILGTSSCHMMVDSEQRLAPGISGVVADGIIPGFFGYEAGQAGVGDMFEWFVEHAVPATYEKMAEERAVSVYTLLEQEAAKQKPGQSGLLALDWWNGCRTPLVDAALSGMIVGASIGTRAPDIFRALIESTAFGTRLIIDTLEKNGVNVKELVACGGLAERNKLLLQIYADVTGREIKEAGSPQTSALGAAMLGARAAGAAAGGYDSLTDAARAMAKTKDVAHKPDPARQAIYQKLYAEYLTLLDYFGRGGNDVMKRLRELRS